MFALWFDLVPLFLVDLSSKILLLALVTSVVLVVLRVRSNSWKHRVWSLVLLGMLLLPALGQMLPTIPVLPSYYPHMQRMPVQRTMSLEPTLPNTGQVPTSVSLPRAAVAASPDFQKVAALQSQPVASEGAFSSSADPAVTLPSEPQVKPIDRTQRRSWLRMGWLPLTGIGVSIIYVVGAIVLLGRIVLGFALTGQLVRRARPIELPVGSDPLPQGSRACESEEIFGPDLQGSRVLDVGGNFLTCLFHVQSVQCLVMRILRSSGVKADFSV